MRNGKSSALNIVNFTLIFNAKYETILALNFYLYKSSYAMKKDCKHYKFINSETDNVIYFLSVPKDTPNGKKVLEDARHKLAIQNGIYIGNIYYIEIPETEIHG
jgi:hypothetical protein